MGLFKRMKDPVRGTGKVVSEDIPTSGSPGSIRLIVTADGVEPTPVEFKVMRGGSYRHLNRWPQSDDSIPVTVDRADPENFTIEWSEMPKVDDRLRHADDLREQAMLAEMRGEKPTTTGDAETDEILQDAEDDLEDARQTWRENLEDGSCDQATFVKEMRDLDGPGWRDRQPAAFLAKHGLRDG
jgi:hypothetical protein